MNWTGWLLGSVGNEKRRDPRSVPATTATVSTDGRDGFSTYGRTDWPLAAQYRYMAAIADDGSFESGRRMLSRIAQWAGVRAPEHVPAPAAC